MVGPAGSIGRRPKLATILIAAFLVGQAVSLFLAGLATIWWSQDLMGLLIHLIGEERALGSGNVIHRPDGGLLLTNPSAMAYYTLPFWALGMVQISGSLSLIALGFRSRPAELPDRS